MKGQLKDIQIVCRIPSGKIVRDLKIYPDKTTNHLVVVGGRPNTHQGFLYAIRYGLKYRSHFTINTTPPTSFWAIKRHVSDKHHSHIVLSYSSRKTVTYLIDSNKLIPTSELHIDEQELSVHVVRMADNMLVQVVPSKIKYINREGSGKQVGIRGRIMKAVSVSEGKQLLILLIGGFIQYYENYNGDLRKIQEISLNA